jgi:uncharacterized protein (TIGR02466 family)
MTETEILNQAQALMEQGRSEEGLALTTPLAQGPAPSLRAIAIHCTLLKGLGRREEALEIDRKTVQRFPADGVAWHNLAATLGDLGRGPESVEAMEKAFLLGRDGALSWGVMARSQLASGDLDKAEAAYQAALKRAPGNEVLANEYADFVWMRHGDLEAAQVVLDRAFHGGGHPAPLILAKVKLYEAAGDHERARALITAAAERMPTDGFILLSAAQWALEDDRFDEAERLALAADALAPDNPSVLNELAIIYLARGRPDLALAKAKRGIEVSPEDQSLWGWAATAARAVGDPLYGQLYDYPAMVKTYELETPDGWPSLEAYLADLAAALDREHLFQHHPSAQSLRHGSQTMYRLTGSSDPAIQAFFRALDAPIRTHMANMGDGPDPVRRRNTGDYRIEGSWSVRLKPGGFHKDHFHPEGWLSSAFYVQTPEHALDSPDKEGWIRFGQPPFKTDPALPAEHYVRPKPGTLVLFPSYMWHGTVPFTTDEKRMTIAFDAVPK